MCGTIHNEGSITEEQFCTSPSICHTNFAGLTVCECCYERIENEILWRPSAAGRGAGS
jgi:hypothetical protein